MRETFDGVAVFVEAVEAGGFARAAERLALTRSAVGKTIARLEARLGVRLFQRTTRSQSLTEEGQIYYERCLRARDELRAGQASLDTGRREVAGRIKISMPILFGRYCVEPILLDLAKQYPRLELDLRFSDNVIDLIAEGFDLAIRNRAPGDGSGLLTRKVATQSKVICAAPSYIDEHGAPLDMAAIRNHSALVYWRNDQPYPWTLRNGKGEVEDAQLQWRLQFDNQEAIVDAAVRGMGIASLPEWLVRDDIATGRLVVLLADFPSVPFETYAVWPAAKHLPMRTRAAIDALAAQLPALSSLKEPGGRV